MGDQYTNVSPYEALGTTGNLHNMVRFGHTDEFSDLFTGEDEDVTDYALGLLFIALVVLNFFIIWTLVICCFKCAGPDRVGFLAGGPFREPPHDSNAVWKGKDWEKITNRVRCCFVFSAVNVMVFSILLVTMGLNKFEGSVSTIDSDNSQLGELLLQAGDHVNSLKEMADQSTVLRDRMITDIENPLFCPIAPGDNVTSAVAEVADRVLEALKDFSTFDSATIDGIATGIKEGQDASSDLDDSINNLDVQGWHGIVIILIHCLLCFFFLIGVALASKRITIYPFRFFLNWCNLPCFFLFMIIMYLLCALVAYSMVANADFCSGGDEQTPDESVLTIARIKGYDNEETTMKMLNYYVSQCQEDDPYAFMDVLIDDLADMKTPLDDYSEIMEEETLPTLNATCGRDFRDSHIMTLGMIDILESASEEAVKSLASLSCDQIVPLYTGITHDTACNDSIKALVWTFSSSLIIAFFGMIMITLRAAYQKNKFYYVDKKRRKKTKEKPDVLRPRVDESYKDKDEDKDDKDKNKNDDDKDKNKKDKKKDDEEKIPDANEQDDDSSDSDDFGLDNIPEKVDSDDESDDGKPHARPSTASGAEEDYGLDGPQARPVSETLDLDKL